MRVVVCKFIVPLVAEPMEEPKHKPTPHSVSALQRTIAGWGWGAELTPPPPIIGRVASNAVV